MVYQKKQIQYIVACISEFARKYRMSFKEAFSILRQYKALDFLYENYESEHTLSMDDAVDDLHIICQKNGGTI